MKFVAVVIALVMTATVVSAESEVSLPRNADKAQKKYEKERSKLEETIRQQKTELLESYNAVLTQEFFALAGKNKEDAWSNKINNYIKAIEAGVELSNLDEKERQAIAILKLVNANMAEMTELSNIGNGTESGKSVSAVSNSGLHPDNHFILTNKWSFASWVDVFKPDGTVEVYNRSGSEDFGHNREWKIDENGVLTLTKGSDVQKWVLAPDRKTVNVTRGSQNLVFHIVEGKWP